MNLEKPTAGTVHYKGQDISKLSGGALRRLRRQIQLVMQDPYTSLNPRMTVGDLIGEPFEIHPEVAPKGSRRDKVKELLDLVGLNPEHINRYPHQFSVTHRIPAGIGVDIDVARVLHVIPDRLNRKMVRRFRCADKAVEPDVEPLVHFLEPAGVARGEIGRRHSLGLRGLDHLLTDVRRCR